MPILEGALARRRSRACGQLGSRDVKFPGILVTQEFLLKEGIKSMDDLRAKLPKLNPGNIASPPWIQAARY